VKLPPKNDFGILASMALTFTKMLRGDKEPGEEHFYLFSCILIGLFAIELGPKTMSAFLCRWSLTFQCVTWPWPRPIKRQCIFRPLVGLLVAIHLRTRFEMSVFTRSNKIMMMKTRIIAPGPFLPSYSRRTGAVFWVRCMWILPCFCLSVSGSVCSWF